MRWPERNFHEPWPSLLKVLGVSVSLAALFLTESWVMVEQASTAQGLYLSPAAPWPVLELTAIVNTALLTALLFLILGGLTLLRAKSQSAMVYALMAAVAQLVLWNFIFKVTGKSILPHLLRVSSGLIPHDVLMAAATGFLLYFLPQVFLFVLILDSRKTWSVIETVCLILAPYAAYRIGQTAWHEVVRPSKVFATKKRILPVTNGNRRPLVLWLLFDGMDYRATYENPRLTPALKNLARLRETAFSAARAFQVSDMTARSVPSYMVGRPVVNVRWDSADELMLRFAGNESYVPWTNQKTLLHEAAEVGRTAAVFGYYHAYCRLFGDLCMVCETLPHPEAGEMMKWWSTLLSEPLHRAAFMQLIRAMAVPPTVVRFDGARFPIWQLWTTRHTEMRTAECVSKLRTSLLRVLADRNIDFVYAHVPLPHPPGLPYHPGSSRAITQVGYDGNLLAVDQLLGEVMELLLQEGRWEETTLIVTSDHSVRDFWKDRFLLDPSLLRAIENRKEPTIPLLVKLPHQKRPLEFSEPFNAVLLHGIVRASLQGAFVQAEDVAKYLEANRARVPLTVPQGREAEGLRSARRLGN